MVLDYDEFETVILVLAYHMYNLQKRTELSFEEYLGEVRCTEFQHARRTSEGWQKRKPPRDNQVVI